MEVPTRIEWLGEGKEEDRSEEDCKRRIDQNNINKYM